MIVGSEKGSPEWWLARLFAKLEQRRAEYAILDTYYRGEHAIPIVATKATRDAYRRLMALARTNFAELVVEAPRERMQVVGFRTGVEGDQQSDDVANRIWQANALDADQTFVHRASLTMGDAYVIVGDVDPSLGVPLITPEDPREVIAVPDPIFRRRSRAALKAFHDDELGIDLAYLYLPGEVHVASREHPASIDASKAGSVMWDGGASWEWDGDVEVLPDPTVVPVVRFANRADLLGRSQGEFEPHLPILDRINYTVLSRLEIATMQAFRQRAIKGLPQHDEAGNEIDYDDVFSMDPGALWQLPETADMWESGVVDLGPIRQAIRDDVQDLAAVTRTPLFYLTPEGANGSAEGASLAREGLIHKTNDRITQAGESWEQVMHLAFVMMRDEERSKVVDLESLWSPPERFSLAERYDAASKASSAGVPWRTVMREVLQFSPAEVGRMETERATDVMVNAPLEPAVTRG